VNTFIAHPWLALVAGGGLLLLWSRRRSLMALLAAMAWGAYGVYEYLMLLRVLCSGDCNIRVDLLVIYPALLVLSTLAVVRSIQLRRSRRDGYHRPEPRSQE
jgi:hypothetical protein